MTRQLFNGAVDLSRRQVLRLGAAGALGVAGASVFGGCAAVPERPAAGTPQKPGGIFMHGATGGGLKDSLDPHFPVTNPDIARVNNLYEPLLFWNEEYKLEPALAESVEVGKDALVWTVRLRKDVVFHSGKTMTAEDVMFTLARVTDPKNTAPGGGELAKILDLRNTKVLDPHTIRFELKSPYAILDQLLAEHTVGIIPTDFDLAKPVGPGRSSSRTSCPASRATSSTTGTTGASRPSSTSCTSMTSPTTPRRSTHSSQARSRASTTCRPTSWTPSRTRAPHR